MTQPVPYVRRTANRVGGLGGSCGSEGSILSLDDEVVCGLVMPALEATRTIKQGRQVYQDCAYSEEEQSDEWNKLPHKGIAHANPFPVAFSTTSMPMRDFPMVAPA